MTITRCDLPDEDLITFAGGELQGARAEYVELHLSNCPDCQRRLEEFAAVDRLIASSGGGNDDPLHRTEIKVRIAELSTHPAGKASYNTWWKPASIVLALALLGYAFLPINSSLADFRLGRVFRFFEAPASVPADTQMDTTAAQSPGSGTLVPVTFDIVAPDLLPAGFKRIEQTRPSTDRIETLYRNADGLTMKLTQMPFTDANYGVSTSGSEVIPMDGIDVIIQSSPGAGTLFAAHWAYNDYVFSTRIEGDGLLQDTVQQIVAVIIKATS